MEPAFENARIPPNIIKPCSVEYGWRSRGNWRDLGYGRSRGDQRCGCRSDAPQWIGASFVNQRASRDGCGWGSLSIDFENSGSVPTIGAPLSITAGCCGLCRSCGVGLYADDGRSSADHQGLRCCTAGADRVDPGPKCHHAKDGCGGRTIRTYHLAGIIGWAQLSAKFCSGYSDYCDARTPKDTGFVCAAGGRYSQATWAYHIGTFLNRFGR